MAIKSNLDFSYLEKMAGGEDSTMKALLAALLTELENNRHTARQLCERQDWSELERFCHHYKSTLSFSGDRALINANNKLWDIAKKRGKNVESLSKTLDTLERKSQSVGREVRRILAEF